MTHASPRSHGRFIFTALLLTLVLSAVLGRGVLVTGRYHRSVAEGVLRDYAGFAAGELEARVQTALAQRIFPVLSEVAARASDRYGGPLPIPARAATVFRMLPGRPLEIRGSRPSDDARRVLADSLPKHAGAVLSPRAYLGLLWLSGQEVAAFASSGKVYGIVLPVTALVEYIQPLLARAPLLPPSLTGGTRLDSAVAYRVLQPGGAPLLASSDAAPGAFSAARQFEANWGGLSVDVSLRESLAPVLVIGGLPRSRLPMVAALLFLNAILLGAALYQIRRERELTRLREDFVAAASHELRTPLAQIRLFTDTLRLGRVRTEEERDRAWDIIQQETGRLSHVVENMLSVSRSSRKPGALSITPRLLDIASELRAAVEAFTPIAAARGVRIDLDGPPSLPVHVDGDAFRQIALNLLENAVKYGPAGQTVTASVGSSDGNARLAVDDHGPGIPPADRARIFQRFVRLPRDTAAGTGGTGIGLALVRELMQLHGGAVWVEDAAGGGARFVAEWPARQGT